MMSPNRVLRDLGRGIYAVFKGSPYNRQMYADLFAVSYQLLRVCAATACSRLTIT